MLRRKNMTVKEKLWASRDDKAQTENAADLDYEREQERKIGNERPSYGYCYIPSIRKWFWCVWPVRKGSAISQHGTTYSAETARAAAMAVAGPYSLQVTECSPAMEYAKLKSEGKL